MDQKHEMILESTHSSGAEEWYCPTCGRRFQIIWEPKFRKTVLEVGDEYASHSGAKSELQMGPVKPKYKKLPGPEENSISNDDSTLAPWIEWLDKVEFENLWNEEG